MARKGFLALMDQAVLSAASFVPHIVLGRFCLEQEYGAYYVAFGVLVALNRLQAALITSPFVVLGPPLEGGGFSRYVRSLLVVQVGMAVAASLAVLAVAAAMRLGGGSALVAASLAGLGCVSVFIELREFLRRVLFVRIEAGAVLLNDAVFGVGVLLGLPALVWAGALSGRNAFLVIGVATAFGVLLGLRQCGTYLGAPSGDLRGTAAAQWRFGRWSLMESVASCVLMDGIIFILPLLSGEEAAGRLGASRNVLAPLQIALFGIANVAAPRAASVFGRAGRAGLNAFLGRVLLASLGLFLPYCLAVVAWPRLPLWLLYGNRYLHEGPGVALWAAVYLLMALRQVVSIGLGAMRRPDILMAASAVSAPVTVALAFLVSAEWGVAGALLARLAGELLCLGISTAGLFRRGVEQHPVVAGSDGRTPSSA